MHARWRWRMRAVLAPGAKDGRSRRSIVYHGRMATADEQVDDEGVVEEAIEVLDWSGERIDAADAVLERGAAYGVYFNAHRAIPDIRDGLKPVHRRILYAMSDMTLWEEKMPVKSAKIVGTVIGGLHPHGDTAVYDAMVTLIRDWVVTLPLITGQGNFGNIDGFPAAAQRYTEAKLSEVGTRMLRADVHPAIVAHKPTFDEKAEEPTVLPFSYPQLLVNGIPAGIGYAMACSVPTHNLGEVVDATILMLEKPETTLKALMRKLPGPDFPGGAIVINPEELAEAYASGKGRVRMLARYHVEPGPGNTQHVVVTELPYGTGPKKIFREVVDGVKPDKKGRVRITEVTEFPVDETDRNGMRLVIKCKRGGDVQALVGQLLANTSMTKTVSLNLTVIKTDGEADTVGVQQIIQEWIDFRYQVIVRRHEHERDGLLARHRQLSALLAALTADMIDEIIRIIRSTSGGDDAVKRKLIARLRWRPYGAKRAVAIDDDQAHYIITTELRKLSRLNQMGLEGDLKKVVARLDEIVAMLADRGAQRDLIVGELRELRRAYARPRRTSLEGVDLTAAAPVLANASATPVQLWVSRRGYATAIPEGKRLRTAALDVGARDRLVTRLDTSTDESVLVFTGDGRCFRSRVAEVVVAPGRNKGKQWIPGVEDVVAVVSDGTTATHLAFVTADGQVKRVEIDMVAGAHAGGIQVMRVEGERICAVLPHGPGAELLAVSTAGQALRTPLDPIRAVKSGNAAGVALMSLPGSSIVAAHIVPAKGELLVVSQAGFAKRVPLDQYPSKGRGGQGVATADASKPTRTPAGPVVLATVVETWPITLALDGGAVFEVTARAVTAGTRASVPRPLALPAPPVGRLGA